jgi:hypothetical protein
MTTPNDDELCKRLRRFIDRDGYLDRAENPSGPEAAARIEALIAERDAAAAFRDVVIGELLSNHIYTEGHETNAGNALHDAIMWNQTVALDPRVSEDARNLVEEGERRATAAIVAWLRTLRSYRVNRSVIAELERGDHITEAKPQPSAS